MKRVIFGLVLMSGLEVAAAAEGLLLSKKINSWSQIFLGYMMPSAGVLGDAKFALYFSAGLEEPCVTTPLVALVGIAGADPVAVSTAFSLANRCMAVTGFHENLEVPKGAAFALVAGADFLLGKIPKLEKFSETKWMGAVGNSAEHTLGMLPGGLALMTIPLSGFVGETPNSEFSEESGMRVFPAILGEFHVLADTILALASFGLAQGLAKNHPLKSRWFASAGVSFMINMLVALSSTTQDKPLI